MTTNDYFDQEMRVMTPDKVLQPRAFALCWDTADQAERRRRDQKLYHLAVDARARGASASSWKPLRRRGPPAARPTRPGPRPSSSSTSRRAAGFRPRR